MKLREIAEVLRREGWLKSANPPTDAQTIKAALRRKEKHEQIMTNIILRINSLFHELQAAVQEQQRSGSR